MEDMTEKELITVLIDKYTDLQRIKRANNGVENQELEYQKNQYHRQPYRIVQVSRHSSSVED